jgi:hypothetical protein
MSRVVQIELDVDGDDIATLRGALLAAKGTELAEAQRLDRRISTGYGSETKTPGMLDDAAHRRRRAGLIDRLLEALARSEQAPP